MLGLLQFKLYLYIMSNINTKSIYYINFEIVQLYKLQS